MPRLVVRFKPEATSEQIIRRREKNHGRQVERLDALGKWRVIDVPDESALEDYRADPNVEYAAPEIGVQGLLAPNDPRFSEQAVHASAMMNTTAAWDDTTGSADVKVAVLDTGVGQHQDLAIGRIIHLAGNDFTVSPAGDNSSDMLSGSINGANGHGILVAGIIGADGDNAISITGIDWNCKILNVRVLDSQNSGTETSVANGIVFAADNGADIINLSLGAFEYSLIMQEAVDYAYANGVRLVIAACGNSGATSPLLYPAAYPNVLAVAGISEDTNVLWESSSRGHHVDVAGWMKVLSTSKLTSGSISRSTNGTSFACPHVSGLASLLLAKYPTMTTQELISRIFGAASRTVWNNEEGWGRIKASASITIVPASAPATPTNVSVTDNVLTWDAVPGTNVRYRVFRDYPPHWYQHPWMGKQSVWAGPRLPSPIALVGSTNLTTFTDTDIEEDHYSYSVQAVTKTGGFSGLSEPTPLPVYFDIVLAAAAPIAGSGEGETSSEGAGAASMVMAGSGEGDNASEGAGAGEAIRTVLFDIVLAAALPISGSGEGDTSSEGTGLGGQVALGQGSGEVLSEGVGVAEVFVIPIVEGSGKGETHSEGLGTGGQVASGQGSGDTDSEGAGVAGQVVPGAGEGSSDSEGLGAAAQISPAAGSGETVSEGVGTLFVVVFGDGFGETYSEGIGILKVPTGKTLSSLRGSAKAEDRLTGSAIADRSSRLSARTESD